MNKIYIKIKLMPTRMAILCSFIVSLFLISSCKVSTRDAGQFYFSEDLYLIHLSGPVTHVTLDDRPKNNFLIIRGYEETGSAYSPTRYMLLTNNVNEKTDKYHFALFQSKVDGLKFFEQNSWTSGDCFGSISSFFIQKRPAGSIYMIRATRVEGDATGSFPARSKIKFELFHLENGSTYLEGNFIFKIIDEKIIDSSACNYTDVYQVERNIFGVHAEGDE